MSIYDYVEDKWGKGVKDNLQNIRKGGDNNAKGTAYEHSYAIYKSCSIAASGANLDAYLISAQEVAFVDDLCIRFGSGEEKTNYQAKNSSGTAADFTDDMRERFEKQAIIDQEHHGFRNSKQVLLVSDQNKAEENQSSINTLNLTNVECEYFPYFPGCATLLLGCEKLREYLGVICQSQNLSVFDGAYRVLLGVWTSEADAISVANLFRKAREIARPNLLAGIGYHEVTVPAWLKDLCGRFPGVEVRVEAGRHVVSYSGLEATLNTDMAAPSPEKVAEVGTVLDLFKFFIDRASTELLN